MATPQYNTRKVRSSYTSHLILSVICIGVGFLIGFSTKSKLSSSYMPIREKSSAYTFIRPLLATNFSKESSQEYEPLEKQLDNFLQQQKQDGSLDTASVYLINYSKNKSLNIHGDEHYDPASLLKVVIMVAYLKKADENPQLLSQKFTYSADVAAQIETIPFQVPTNLQTGNEYTVSELLDNMIINSDNGAKDLLLAHMDDGYLNQVYTDLGIDHPKEDKPYTISTRDYSLFFRILYNATYLSRTNSEKALSILSKTVFAEGLRDGVPTKIPIAHKFGEHVEGTNDNVQYIELHDCGIVYDTNDTYLLCVMTKGKTVDALSKTISNISKMVYDYVANN